MYLSNIKIKYTNQMSITFTKYKRGELNKLGKYNEVLQVDGKFNQNHYIFI